LSYLHNILFNLLLQNIKRSYMSFKNLLKRGSRVANRPPMASFLHESSLRAVANSIQQKNKNLDMSHQKSMSVPAHIFSWEYNMNELEFE